MFRHRRIVIIAAAFLLFGTGILLVAGLFFSADRWKPFLKAELEKQLRLPVEIRACSFSLWGGMQLQAAGIRIGTAQPYGEVERVSLSFSLFSLLRGKTEPSGVLLQKVRLSFQEKNDSWEIRSGGEGLPSPLPDTSREAPGAPGRTLPLIPDSLQVEDAGIQLFRHGSADPLELGITRFSFRKNKASRPGWVDFQAELQAEFLRGKAAEVSPLKAVVAGGYEPQTRVLELQKAEVQAGQSRFQAEVRMEGLSSRAKGKVHLVAREARPEDLLRFMALFRTGNLPLKTSGTIRADLSLEGSLAHPRFSGSLETDELRFFYADQGEPVCLSRLAFSLNGDQVQSNVFQAGLCGRSSVALSLQADHLGTDPLLHFHAETSRPIPLREMLRVASSFGLSWPVPPEVVSGHASFQLNGQGVGLQSGHFDITGQMSLQELALQPKDLKETLLLSPVEVRLDRNRIQAGRFTLSLGGSEAVEVSQFDLTDRPEGPAFLARARSLQSLSADRWLKVVQPLLSGIPETVRLVGGRLTLSAEMQRHPGRPLEFSSTGRFQNGTVALKQLGESLEIETCGFDLSGRRFSLDAVKGRLAGVAFRGNLQGTIPNQGPAVVRFDLQADRLDLDRWAAKLAVAPAPAAKPVSAPAPAGAVELFQIEQGRLRIQGAVFREKTVSDVDLTLAYKDRTLSVPSLDFKLYDGIHHGKLQADFRTNPPPVQYQGRIQNMDLQKFLQDSPHFRGALRGRFQTELSLQGRIEPAGDPAGTLRGSGQYQVTEGRLTSVSLARQIQAITRLTGWDISAQGTDIPEAKGNYLVEGKTLRLTDTRIRTPEALVSAAGTVQPEERTMDLTATAQLSSQWKPSGNALGQLISGAAELFFREESGRMIVPLRITGFLEKPSFALDQQALRSGMRNALNPENIRSGIRTLRNIWQQISAESASGGSDATTTTTTTLPGSPQ